MRPTHPSGRSRALALLIAAGLFVGSAHAQQGDAPPPERAPELWETHLAPIPETELRERYQTNQRKRSDMERELRRIRAEYFRGIRNQQIRQAGIARIREYTDPVIYPSLIEIFARDGDDVRSAILDHLVDQHNDEADTVMAWTAIFDKDKTFRALAAERLKQRLAIARSTPGVHGPTPRIKSVIAEGLRRNRDEEVAAAAQLAQFLQLAEAIPMLINAQMSAGGQRSSGRETSLAWILVGQQQAYVSDLTPVVGQSAVAFDPQLSVLTTGTVLRVIDAVVVTYRIDVHNALVGLTTDLWGRPTAHLGWDGSAWAKWYTEEFRPYWAVKEKEMQAAREREARQRELERLAPKSPEIDTPREPAETPPVLTPPGGR